MLPVRGGRALVGDDPGVGIHKGASREGRVGRQQCAVAFGDVIVQGHLVVGRRKCRVGPHNLGVQVKPDSQGQAGAKAELEEGVHDEVSEES